jgi:tetratricopeptide (TPR) repeat protein
MRRAAGCSHAARVDRTGRVPALAPVVALACVLAAAASARAAEDAGTQSVFAHGAGNRASAMGAAFVAAVDDASALVWNPAGLGRISRAELQAAQSGDLGLGMSDSYAALALPSWRWGTAGVSLRHFGVGGIERRDARDVLLAEDLSDSEFELALGYGCAVGDAWTVGGALKLQRQALAGLSGSGLGVDVGLTARPAAALGIAASWVQGLTWGLALRNAVAPAIRLDRESVPDPLLVRTGLAWRTPIGAGGGLLAELDLSRTAGASPRAHAGLEYRMAPAAALRVGLDDGTLTAGTGLGWHDLSVDYAFESNALSVAHRAGLTLRFGASTEESRLAHARREDALIERRLTEAFHQRQADQVAGLLERAGEARSRGDFDEALEALALVATLEPGRADAASLERACLADKALLLERSQEFAAASLVWDRVVAGASGDSAAIAGAARCRAASDQRARRNSEIRAEFARALDAFANEDLIAARAGFQAVLQGTPSDAEAARMLQRTERAITRRAERLAEQAARALRSGDLDGAQAALAEAQWLDRASPSVAQAGLALTRTRQAADATRAARAAGRADSARTGARDAAPAAPRLAEREVEDLYQRGLAALRARRNDDALRYWELVWSSRPGYREVAAYLKREYLTRGMEAFASGRLDEAMTQWERVLRVDPSDERARGYLARAAEQRARSREILGGAP